MRRIPSRPVLQLGFRKLNVGDKIEPDEIANLLARGGYQRVNLVEIRGEYSSRGDILDVYPLVCDKPIRIEFFGDEIDTIRLFDPASQTSITALESVILTPMCEVLLLDETVEAWQTRAEQTIETSTSPKFQDAIQEITQHLENRTNLQGIEALLSLIHI